jgi:hypothetical protein
MGRFGHGQRKNQEMETGLTHALPEQPEGQINWEMESDQGVSD